MRQNQVCFAVYMYGTFMVDNVRVLADDLENETTMVYNDGNELTSQTDRNGTTTYTYDDWGRTLSKYRGSYSADYEWNYGSMMTRFDSDFFDEGTVDYEYGGDQNRRSRDDGTNFTWYNWDQTTMIQEENQGAGVGNGTLAKTYIGGLAEVDSATPSTGDYSYYMSDHLGSTRSIFDESKAQTGLAEFTPFGDKYTAQNPVGIEARYTVHQLDPTANLYYAKYRYYSPQTSRWMKRDPLGMVDGPNLYTYVKNGPTVYGDELGFSFRSFFGKIIPLTHPVIGGAQIACGTAHLGYELLIRPWLFENAPNKGKTPKYPNDNTRQSLRHCIVVCRARKCGFLGGEIGDIGNRPNEKFGGSGDSKDDIEAGLDGKKIGESLCDDCNKGCQKAGW